MNTDDDKLQDPIAEYLRDNLYLSENYNMDGTISISICLQGDKHPLSTITIQESIKS